MFWQADTPPVLIGKKNAEKPCTWGKKVRFECPSPTKPGEDHDILS